MNQNFDIFNQVEMPSIMLCTPNLEKVHAIDSLIFGTGVKLRYNAMSEFSFSIPESIDGNQTTLFVYSLIKNMKYIHIENIGYFIIREVEENDEGLVKIKEVKCESLESELKNTQIVDFERISIPIVDSLINVIYKLEPTQGTTYFEDFVYEEYPNGNPVILSSTQGEGILDIIKESYVPNWSLDQTKTIPEGLVQYGGETNTDLIALIVRGFKTSNSNVYKFLTEDVEKAFSCAVIFNKEERTFYLETLSSIEETNIFLSYDNLLKSSSVREQSEELATCLSCYGESNFSINYANPLGNSKIYNFDYFKTLEWMPETLITKIDEWKTAMFKEMNGTVGGSNPGEAWGTIEWLQNGSGGVGRYIAALYYTNRLGYQYYYTRYRRQREIAGQKRLVKTVAYESTASKSYKTNADFLINAMSGTLPYPTTTLTYYTDLDNLKTIQEVSLTSSSQIFTSGFEQPNGVQSLQFLCGANYGAMSFSVEGTNYLDAFTSETVVSSLGSAYTIYYYKTITKITYPPYASPGNFVTVFGLTQDLRPTATITDDFKLKNIYNWQQAGGLSQMYTNMAAFTHQIARNDSKTKLKDMTSSQREKYSNLVQYLFYAYEDRSRNNTGITYLENLIAEQEILMATAIELNNNSKKQDHQTNIRYIRNLVISKFNFVGYAGIPSEDNVSGYVLNDDQNKMDLQSFIDNRIIPGTRTDGEVVDPEYSVGGLYQAQADNLSIETFIDDLIGTEGVMTYISSQLSLETFFGALYEPELVPFIIENTYQNEYAVNFSQDIKDKVSSSIELYNQSTEILSKVSQPRYEISIDLLNFINLYEYKESFIKELALGKKIRLNIKNSVLSVILLELEYSFDDLKDMNMTFGNRLRLDDSSFQYTDFVGQIYKTSSNVSFDKTAWSTFDKNYKDSVLLVEDNAVNLDSTDQTSLNSTNLGDQTFEVSVTKSGLLVRRKLDDENYFRKQLLFTNGTIAYTDNDWTTFTYK